MNSNKKQIQKDRLEYAEMRILELGIDIVFKCESRIEFYYNDELIQFFPFKSWSTGKSIQDGRGLENLLKQLK